MPAFNFSMFVKESVIFLLLLLPSTISFADPSASNQIILNAYDSAIAQYIRTENELAIHNFTIVLQSASTDTAIQKRIVKSFSFIGIIYNNQGKSLLALQQFQKGLKFAEKTNDKNGEAQLLLSLGELYYYWHRFDEALKYYEQAERILLITGDQKLIGDCFIHKGAVLEQKADLQKALLYYKKALAIFEKLDRPNTTTAALTNIGNVYCTQRDFITGIQYLKKALSIATEYQNKDNISCCLINLGIAYDSLNNLAQAEIYWNQSIKVAKETGSIEALTLGYEALSDIYARDKKFQLAYEYNLKHSVLKDSLFNVENTKQVREVNIKYETEKKEKKISDQELFIHRQKNKQRDILVGSVILILATISSILFYQQKNKAKQEKQQFGLILDAEQKERMRIARDLHDSIGQMLSVVKMQLSSLKSQHNEAEQKTVEQTKDLLDKTIQEVRHISHNLIPEELNFGIISALEELCNKINTSEIKVTVQIDESLNAQTFNKQFELSLYRIVQEILSNMLKHAAAKEIIIKMEQKANIVLLDIQDDGKGFDPSIIQESNGLGWKNIFARVSLLNGKMDIHSERIKGTQIQIILPQ